MPVRLLFVDDHPRWKDMIADVVNDWNAENPDRPFDLTVCDRADEARAHLASNAFDCALLDLKLPGGADGGATVDNGSQLALDTLETVSIPIAILSGNPEDRAAALHDEQLVRAFKKSGDIGRDIIEWLGAQWPMMKSLRTARETIQKTGVAVFRSRIWPRWERYGNIVAGGAPLDKIITRQFAAHIAELMGTDGGENPDWHPLENYVSPALLNHRPHTGDMFRINERLWVVLTPQCDMANDNVEDVLLARCDEDALPKWQRYVDRLTANANDAEAQDWFGKKVNQGISPSQHFLPPLEGRPIMVNFNALRTMPLTDLKARLDTDRLASVSPPFLSNLVQRFASYMARPGQPNIGVQHFAAG